MSGRPLDGDWRSRAYGADKLVHEFVWLMGAGKKAPACGVRDNGTYGRRETTTGHACRECLHRREVFA